MVREDGHEVILCSLCAQYEQAPASEAPPPEAPRYADQPIPVTGRPAPSARTRSPQHEQSDAFWKALKDKDVRIGQLEAEIARLQEEREELAAQLAYARQAGPTSQAGTADVVPAAAAAAWEVDPAPVHVDTPTEAFDVLAYSAAPADEGEAAEAAESQSGAGTHPHGAAPFAAAAAASWEMLGDGDEDDATAQIPAAVAPVVVAPAASQEQQPAEPAEPYWVAATSTDSDEQTAGLQQADLAQTDLPPADFPEAEPAQAELVQAEPVQSEPVQAGQEQAVPAVASAETPAGEQPAFGAAPEPYIEPSPLIEPAPAGTFFASDAESTGAFTEPPTTLFAEQARSEGFDFDLPTESPEEHPDAPNAVELSLMQRGVDLFNVSSMPRRVAETSELLGLPRVSITADEQTLTATLVWSMAWYEYVVSLDDGDVQLQERGYEDRGDLLSVGSVRADGTIQLDSLAARHPAPVRPVPVEAPRPVPVPQPPLEAGEDFPADPDAAPPADQRPVPAGNPDVIAKSLKGNRTDDEAVSWDEMAARDFDWGR